MYYSEKRAKEFLAIRDFNILHSVYFFNQEKLKKFSEHFKFPVAMKVSGKDIVHKAKIGGVKLDVRNSREVMRVYRKFMKIKGADGVVVQNQIRGKELILGVKKTPEFGHVVLFGSGGHDVEKIKDVSFRVLPLSKMDALEMVSETNIFRKLKDDEVKLVVKNILKFNSLIKKNPKILELDINPLILSKGKAQVVDARILFE